MRAVAPVLTLALVTGCARKAPEDLYDRAAALDWPTMPRVPSPDATAYSDGRENPRDPMLYRLLEGFAHDGSLAAAATALALDATNGLGTLTRWRLREAAWRGGWPYPIEEAREWRTWNGSIPPRDLIAWLETLGEEEPMALVRARGRQEDVWIGLRATPPVDLGPLPRMASLGTPMRLPAIPGAEWTVADPAGNVQQGTLDEPATILLQRTGEWLVVVTRARRDLARFPVYVDTPAPTRPVLQLDDPPPVSDSDDADRLAEELLALVRDAWDAPVWERSGMFDAAVRAYAEDPSKGSRGVLTSVGYGDAEGVAWACDDVTVQGCLDRWLWDPRRRTTLVSGDIDSYGLHTVLDDTGVHLTLLLVDAR